MIFTLEALEARHGDSLILHYGSESDPQIMVIDGGPPGVHSETLKPRLEELQTALAPGEELPLQLMMVSHMDSDHVAGVLDVVEEVRDAREDHETPLVDIRHLWVNTFDDVIGSIEVPHIASLSSQASVADLLGAVPAFAELDEHVNAVIASTNQGRKLRDLAEALDIPVNAHFDEIAPGKAALVRGDTTMSRIDFGDGLTIDVIAPSETRLLKMQEKWDKDLKKAREKGDDRITVASFSRDTSPFNLASIVCVVEFGGKRMLLTGDARSDDIVAGLEEADFLDSEGKCHFDILKMPHHGSNRNVTPEFFEKITADHYVASGNGEHHNPDRSTLEMLSRATRGRDDFTIHLTNHEGKHHLKATLDSFLAEDRDRGRSYEFLFRDPNALSLRIDLLDGISV